MGGLGRGVPTVLHTSVATLYSNLVTRPTGRAVRLAIERQIQDASGACLSILDFSHVGVIDYSCADEVIAKLLLRYEPSDRPAEAYFIVQGVSDAHRDPIEDVLRHHGLLLVASKPGSTALWGPAPDRLRRAWHGLAQRGHVSANEFATDWGLSRDTASSWLRRLAERRVAITDVGSRYVSLPALLSSKLASEGGPQPARP